MILLMEANGSNILGVGTKIGSNQRLREDAEIEVTVYDYFVKNRNIPLR